MNLDPDLGGQTLLRKSAFLFVLEEVVGAALVLVGGAFIKSEQTLAVILTIIVGSALLGLGIFSAWKNRRAPHE